MTEKTVVVIGSGVAGLSAALELAQLDISVEIVEKSDFAGGHAIRFACKATDQCVKCGACIVEEKLDQAVRNPRIRILTGSRIESISKTERYAISLHQKPKYINAKTCSGCGVCLQQCSQDAPSSRASPERFPFSSPLMKMNACIWRINPAVDARRSVRKRPLPSMPVPVRSPVRPMLLFWPQGLRRLIPKINLTDMGSSKML